jgi:hypothetical protein
MKLTGALHGLKYEHLDVADPAAIIPLVCSSRSDGVLLQVFCPAGVGLILSN